jgi:hypothetical protein
MGACNPCSVRCTAAAGEYIGIRVRACAPTNTHTRCLYIHTTPMHTRSPTHTSMHTYTLAYSNIKPSHVRTYIRQHLHTHIRLHSYIHAHHLTRSRKPTCAHMHTQSLNQDYECTHPRWHLTAVLLFLVSCFLLPARVFRLPLRFCY